MAPSFSHELRVRYGECDPQGIVFNAHYVAYIDHAFTELWREAFGSFQAVLERGVDVVVAALEIDFCAPARFDDVITIEAGVERLGTTSITTRIEMSRDDEPLIRSRIRHVVLDRESWTKTPLPDWLREGLEPYLVAT